jgi:hypothetical protein
MGIFVIVMIVTALWIVLGAVLHDGRDRTRDLGAQTWWWEASERSAGLAYRQSLPPSHPLARLGRSPSSIG